MVRDLNKLMLAEPALYERDFEPEGFAWIDGSDTAHSVIAFIRYARHKTHPLIIVGNFTPTPRYGYRVGVPFPGAYAEIFNSDSKVYGGSNVGNLGQVVADREPMHGYPYSIPLTLPPLAVMMLRPSGRGVPREPAREPAREQHREQQREGSTQDSQRM
jgi:1,4-alpha-glucan branching enzyme